MRLIRIIDANALIDELEQRCCANCVKRMGMKNGKREMIYEIGDAPCLACEVNDMKVELDEAPTIEAEPVVKCKDCRYAHMTYGGECKYCDAWEEEGEMYLDGDFYCAFGERKKDE